MIRANKITINAKEGIAVRTKGKVGDLLDELTGIVSSLVDCEVTDKLIIEAVVEGLKEGEKKKNGRTYKIDTDKFDLKEILKDLE